VTATDIFCDGWSGRAALDMGRPRLLSPPTGEPLQLSLAPEVTVVVHRVCMGNPHAVLFVDSITDQLVRDYGPAIEQHSALPERSNVEFVAVEKKHELKIRVWERGSGETKSCGSGACAAVAAAVAAGRIAAGPACHVHFAGGILEVTRLSSGRLRLSGPVEVSCVGRLVY